MHQRGRTARINGAAGSLVPWTPATENWGLLGLRGNYSAATGIWTGTASAGASGGRNVAPVSGTNPADAGDGTPFWNETTGAAQLQSDVAVTFPNYSSYAAGTFFAIYRATVATFNTLVTSTRVSLGQSFSVQPTEALFGSVTDSGGSKSQFVLNAAGPQWHLAVIRWDSTNLSLWLDNSLAAAVPCGAVLNTDVRRLGVGNSACRGLTIRDFGAAPVAHTDATVAKLYAWAVANGRFR